MLTTAINGEIHSNTIIIGDFNTPLSKVDRSSKMKINKETQALSDTLNKMDLIDIYMTFHPKTTEYTFFFFFFNFFYSYFIYLFIYFWLCWVFGSCEGFL